MKLCMKLTVTGILCIPNTTAICSQFGTVKIFYICVVVGVDFYVLGSDLKNKHHVIVLYIRKKYGKFVIS